jgi:hypothetical protein
MRPRGGGAGWILAIACASCSSPDGRASEAPAPPAVFDATPVAPVVIDAGAPVEVAAAVDAAVVFNPFSGGPCPVPIASKARKGSGDQSTALTDRLLQPRLEVDYLVGDPTLPESDPVVLERITEEEVFCGVIVALDGEAVRIQSEGPEDHVLVLTIDAPLERPFAVGSAVVVHAREAVELDGEQRLSVLITDAQGRLLLAQVEGRSADYAPGFHIAEAPEPNMGRGTPARGSRPPVPSPRAVYISRGGKRAESQDTWRVLDTGGERFAVLGVVEPIKKQRGLWVRKVRILRLPEQVGR